MEQAKNLGLHELPQGSSNQPSQPSQVTGQLLSFEIELSSLINKYSYESGSDTPDFILVGYLMRCINNWNYTVGQRERYYNREIKHSTNILR